jgi:fatty acid desaturase
MSSNAKTSTDISNDRYWSKEVFNYLSSEELKEFYKIDSVIILRDGLASWAIIVLALAFSATFPNPLILFVSFLVIGARQLAISHLVHEAAHYNFSRNKKRNDWVSDIFFAAPILLSTADYRSQHQPHHNHLGQIGEDTDDRAWYTIKGAHFIWRTLLTISGFEAFKTFLSYRKIADKNKDVRRTFIKFGLIGLTNSIILGYCDWLGAWWLYFLLWLVPLLTWTVYLLTIRVIAEHQKESYAAAGLDDFSHSIENPLARTITAGYVERFFLGSMNFCYHHEHHLFPAIPYPKLPKVHRLLLQRGYYDKRPDSRIGSYWQVLRMLIWPRIPHNNI